MLKKQIAKTVAAGLFALAAGQASAFNLSLGGAVGNVNFEGIDWDSNGAAWVQGFQGGVGPTLGIGTQFDLYYMSKATALYDSVGNTLSFIGSIATNGTAFNTVEMTFFAKLTEEIINVGVDPVTLKPFANFEVVSGAWDVYLDTTPNASLASGTGFTDGTKILGGGFTAGVAGSFTNLNGTPGGAGANGTGSNALFGDVTFTDSAYVTPSPSATLANTTLQYGLSAGGWTRPSGFEGLAGYAAFDTPASFVLRGDANQDFSIPEPTSMALLGLGFAALGIRRRKA